MDNGSVWNATFMVYACEASKQEENQSLPSAENICSSCKTSIIPYTDLIFTLNKKIIQLSPVWHFRYFPSTGYELI